MLFVLFQSQHSELRQKCNRPEFRCCETPSQRKVFQVFCQRKFVNNFTTMPFIGPSLFCTSLEDHFVSFTFVLPHFLEGPHFVWFCFISSVDHRGLFHTRCLSAFQLNADPGVWPKLGPPSSCVHMGCSRATPEDESSLPPGHSWTGPMCPRLFCFLWAL